MGPAGDATFSLDDRAEVLRRSRPLSGLPEAAIQALAALMETRRHEDMHVLASSQHPGQAVAFTLIVQGTILAHGAHDGGDPRRLLGPGAVLGAGSLLDHVLARAGAPPRRAHVWDAYAVEPCWVLELPIERYPQLGKMLDGPGVIEVLRRAVDEPCGMAEPGGRGTSRRAAGPGDPTSSPVRDVSRAGPRVVLLLASELVQASLPLRPLALALARSMSEHLGDRVQVVRLDPMHALSADALSRRLADSGNTGEAEGADVVLIDASALAPGLAERRALAAAVRGIGARARISYLFSDPGEWSRVPFELGPACASDLVLPTVVLPPALPEGVGRTLERTWSALDHAESRGLGSFLGRLRSLPDVARQQVRRLSGLERGAVGVAARRQIAPDPGARVTRPVWPRGAVRVRLSAAARAELRRRDGKPGLVGDAWSPAAWIASAGGDAGDRASFERWGRALTGRRVGVAIGGAGALSYAGVPLLRALRAAGVPVDMVSGTSFGSVVAAYYAAHGEEGLELLSQHWYWAQLTVALGWVSPRPFQWWINHDLGFVDVAELDVPVIPVTTNAHNGHEWDVRGGPVGYACSASGSIPPLAPTYDGDTRLIDGAISAAVPSRALVENGADMVVGVNVMPLPRPGPTKAATIPIVSGLARELDPVTRIRDTVRSYMLLFRQASYSQERFTDVMYASESPVGNGATFYKRHALMHHAERSESLEQAVARARERYEKL